MEKVRFDNDIGTYMGKTRFEAAAAHSTSWIPKLHPQIGMCQTVYRRIVGSKGEDLEGTMS